MAKKRSSKETAPAREYPQQLVDKLTAKQFQVLSDQLSNNESSSDAQMTNFLHKEIGVSKDKLSTIIKHFRPEFRKDPEYVMQRDTSKDPSILSFTDYMRSRGYDNWYKSNSPVKYKEEAGAKHIKDSEYDQLEKEYYQLYPGNEDSRSWKEYDRDATKAADGAALEKLQDDVHDNPTPTELQEDALQLADGGGLETTEYDRVIPRDFFNEAKLLKCMGLIALKILDRQLPDKMDIVIEEKGEPFDIQLTSDGLLFVANYPVTINGIEVFFGSTYNAKASYPLVAVIDYTEYPVFDEDGGFSEEFRTMPLSIKPTARKAKKKMAEGGLPEDATQSQVFAKEGAALKPGTMIPNNQAAVYAAERLPFTGTNLEGKKLLNDDYVVLSFLCYPVWLYSSADGKWYGNKDKFNTITAMHQSESRPDFNAEMIPLHELYKKLFGSIQKFDMGGPVTTLYPMSLDNALEAHG